MFWGGRCPCRCPLPCHPIHCHRYCQRCSVALASVEGLNCSPSLPDQRPAPFQAWPCPTLLHGQCRPLRHWHGKNPPPLPGKGKNLISNQPSIRPTIQPTIYQTNHPTNQEPRLCPSWLLFLYRGGVPRCEQSGMTLLSPRETTHPILRCSQGKGVGQLAGAAWAGERDLTLPEPLLPILSEASDSAMFCGSCK